MTSHQRKYRPGAQKGSFKKKSKKKTSGESFNSKANAKSQYESSSIKCFFYKKKRHKKVDCQKHNK